MSFCLFSLSFLFCLSLLLGSESFLFFFLFFIIFLLFLGYLFFGQFLLQLQLFFFSFLLRCFHHSFEFDHLKFTFDFSDSIFGQLFIFNQIIENLREFLIVDVVLYLLLYPSCVIQCSCFSLITNSFSDTSKLPHDITIPVSRYVFVDFSITDHLIKVIFANPTLGVVLNPFCVI